MIFSSILSHHRKYVIWNWFTRREWKRLEKQTRESLEHCKQRVMGYSGTLVRMLIEMWTVGAALMKFQIGMKILMGIGLEAIHIMF
jgi:hypothetical protein